MSKEQDMGYDFCPPYTDPPNRDMFKDYQTDAHDTAYILTDLMHKLKTGIKLKVTKRVPGTQCISHVEKITVRLDDEQA